MHWSERAKLSITDSNNLLAEYPEGGRGWMDLIKPLVQRCNEEGVRIEQIKEKFGTLRFYVDSASEELYDAIHAAELASASICQYCGQPGKQKVIRGWVYTMCGPCETEK